MDECRERGFHAWSYRPDENMERPDICAACGTRRFNVRDSDGNLVMRRYEYPSKVQHAN